MEVEQVGALVQGAIMTVLLVSAPILAGAMALGLTISILQAATQVNEQTLTFVPKIVVVLGLFALLFPWMMRTILVYAHALFETAANRGLG